MAKVTTLWHTDPAAGNSLNNPNEIIPQTTELVFDTCDVYACGEDPVAFYYACREHIVHAHFKDGCLHIITDNDGSTLRDFSNELIGEGDINFTECVKAMVKDGYKGYVDIEYESNKYTPDAANKKAIENINNILRPN